jgi:LmbE family N-acetylglucosaminyl deacetylase
LFSYWRHRLESMPVTPPPDPGGRVVIISAHPDDEVLAVGGWIASHADRDFVFVTATDGEASHPDSPTISPLELRRRRPRELVAALQALGVADPHVIRLGLPDGEVAKHRDEVVETLRPVVAEADLVLAPFEADGHPDHDVLGEVAIELCGDSTPLWRFPIWTWVWTTPEDGERWFPSARRLDCRSAARGRKRRAVRAFTTQVRPLSDDPRDAAVVGEPLLNHALLAPEVVLV